MPILIRAAVMASALLFTSGAASAAPVSLAAALQSGAETSPRVAQARALLEAAEARARQAGVGPNPELGLVVENFGGTGPYRAFRSTETTLEVSQRFELGGKRSARRAAARAERDTAAIALLRAQADLARDIRVAHAELGAAAERVALAEDNVNRARELARITGLLVYNGRDPPLRKLRADAILAEATAEASRANGDYRIAQRTLMALTGIDDDDISAGDPTDIAPTPALPGMQTLDECFALAERDASNARIELARSDAVPDITAGGGIRRFGDGGETAIVASVSIPIPVRNRNQGGIAAARSDAVAADANLAQIRLDAGRNRRDAATRLAAADDRLAALSGAGIAQAEEAVRIAQIGYNAGKFSLVELIDAQAALNTAKLAVIEARLDRSRALAELIRFSAQCQTI